MGSGEMLGFHEEDKDGEFIGCLPIHEKTSSSIMNKELQIGRTVCYQLHLHDCSSVQ